MSEQVILRNHGVFYIIGELDAGANLKNVNDATYDQAIAAKILKEYPVITLSSLVPEKKLPEKIFAVIGNMDKSFDKLQEDIEDMHCSITPLILDYQITTHFPELFSDISNEVDEYIMARYGDYGIKTSFHIQDARVFDGEVKEVDFNLDSFSNFPDTIISEDILSFVGSICLKIMFEHKRIISDEELEAFNKTFYGK